MRVLTEDFDSRKLQILQRNEESLLLKRPTAIIHHIPEGGGCVLKSLKSFIPLNMCYAPQASQMIDELIMGC